MAGTTEVRPTVTEDKFSKLARDQTTWGIWGWKDFGLAFALMGKHWYKWAEDWHDRLCSFKGPLHLAWRMKCRRTRVEVHTCQDAAVVCARHDMDQKTELEAMTSGWIPDVF